MEGEIVPWKAIGYLFLKTGSFGRILAKKQKIEVI
jgi:hypothetical protein